MKTFCNCSLLACITCFFLLLSDCLLPVLSMLFLLTLIGGGIPHGVLEMRPGGNFGQLTEHRPRWMGTHETVQSPPDTVPMGKTQTDPVPKCKTQTDPVAKSKSQNDPVPILPKCKTQTDPAPKQGLGAHRESGHPDYRPRTPDLGTDCVSAVVVDSPTHTVAHAQADAQASAAVDTVVSVSEPLLTKACKFSVEASVHQETARPRRESSGEQLTHRPLCTNYSSYCFKQYEMLI